LAVLCLVQKHLQSIKTVTIHDCADVHLPLFHLGDYFGFKNMEKLVLNLKECPSDYEGYKGHNSFRQGYPLGNYQGIFEAKAKGNKVKEIQFRGGVGFFKKEFVEFHQEFFPHLEKLVIDQFDQFDQWKLRFLPYILENLALIRNLEIWGLKAILDVNPKQTDDFNLAKMRTACVIINCRFPSDSKVELIDILSKRAIVKKKWGKAIIVEEDQFKDCFTAFLQFRGW